MSSPNPPYSHLFSPNKMLESVVKWMIASATVFIVCIYYFEWNMDDCDAWMKQKARSKVRIQVVYHYLCKRCLTFVVICAFCKNMVCTQTRLLEFKVSIYRIFTELPGPKEFFILFQNSSWLQPDDTVANSTKLPLLLLWTAFHGRRNDLGFLTKKLDKCKAKCEVTNDKQ